MRPASLIVLLAAVALMLAIAATAISSDRPPVIIVYGDTIAIGDQRIRLLDIDAPESFRSRCEAELVFGLKAKERLRQLVDSGPT